MSDTSGLFSLPFVLSTRVCVCVCVCGQSYETLYIFASFEYLKEGNAHLCTLYRVNHIIE